MWEKNICQSQYTVKSVLKKMQVVLYFNYILKCPHKVHSITQRYLLSVLQLKTLLWFIRYLKYLLELRNHYSLFKKKANSSVPMDLYTKPQNLWAQLKKRVWGCEGPVWFMVCLMGEVGLGWIGFVLHLLTSTETVILLQEDARAVCAQWSLLISLVLL